MATTINKNGQDVAPQITPNSTQKSANPLSQQKPSLLQLQFESRKIWPSLASLGYHNQVGVEIEWRKQLD
jgi:hypothetical protein